MYGGFDKDDYGLLGDAAMGPIRANTNLRWIGFYLNHGPLASGSEWTARRNRTPAVSTWRFLRSEGWGSAPIFIARQFVKSGGLVTHNPNWTEANGTLDGNNAVAIAQLNNAGHLCDIERGATLYLDLEDDGFASVPAAQKYLKGWFDAVRAAGFRQGVYCWGQPATVHPAWKSDNRVIRQLFPDVTIWFIRMPEVQPKVYDEPSGRLSVLPFSNFFDDDGTASMFGNVASQFAWYNPQRAFTQAKLKTGPTTTITVAPIDFDASIIPDPSHPEDRVALAFSRFKGNTAAVFALGSSGASWQYNDGDWGQWGQGVCFPENSGLADLGYGKWFDIRSVAAASRQPELVDIFGAGIDGSIWTSWRTPDNGGVDGVWANTPQIISPTGSARHGSAVAACSRATDKLDVFYFNTRQELSTTWWSPDTPDWLGHNFAIAPGIAFAPGSNIEAVVSPTDTERIDLFAVDTTNGVQWVQWRNSQPWQSAPIPPGNVADPALGVHSTWFNGQLHLLVGMRDGSVVHLSHPDGNLGTPWTTVATLPSFGGLARPMGIAMAALDDALAAVLILSNQTLAWSTFDGLAWGVPGFDNANPPYSSSGRIVANRWDGNSVDVILPNQNAQVFMKRLTKAPLPFAPLILSNSWEMIL